MRYKGKDIWSWEAGISGIGYGGLVSLGQKMDDSLSLEMEAMNMNLRHLWEKPLETCRSFGERFCDACRHVTGLKDNFADRRATIKRKLNEWMSSLEIAVIGQYRMMESALAPNNCPDTTPSKNSLHLVSAGYVSKVPLASRSALLCSDEMDFIEGVSGIVILRLRDFEGVSCNLINRHLELRAVLFDTNGEEEDILVSRSAINGEYELCIRATTPGVAILSVKLHGIDVAGSPVNIKVHPKKNWDSSIIPKFFGKEGTLPGEFVRPWGVGTDGKGRILVADRSNHRVQVYSNEGMFLFKFGKKGIGPGEFQLVSSVAGAPNGDIIAVDKDNHRISLFDINGHFKFSFGKEGQNDGEFHYPWDVDVNALGQIVVTDSKNRRIQLFNAAGKFLAKFTREDCPEMDNPRGVCFMSTDQITITDFNLHKIAIVNLKTKKYRFVGHEGSGPGELKRPQGVAWHPQGFIVVSDSRNNRVQALDQNGSMVWQFASTGLLLDRPCGVTVTKTGKVAGVDFGNNRVFILQ